jgi:Aldolase/RraA
VITPWRSASAFASTTIPTPASSDLIGSRRPQPCDVDQDQRYAAFAAFGAATVHEAQGGTGALDSAIKPLSPDTVVAGPALTVDTRPGDNLALHYAMTVARSGDVLGSNPTRPTQRSEVQKREGCVAA